MKKTRFDLILDFDPDQEPEPEGPEGWRTEISIGTRWLRLRQLEALERLGIRGTEGEQVDHLLTLSQEATQQWPTLPNTYRQRLIELAHTHPNFWTYREVYDPNYNYDGDILHNDRPLYGPMARLWRGRDFPEKEDTSTWNNPTPGTLLHRERIWARLNRINRAVMQELEQRCGRRRTV